MNHKRVTKARKLLMIKQSSPNAKQVLLAFNKVTDSHKNISDKEFDLVREYVHYVERVDAMDNRRVSKARKLLRIKQRRVTLEQVILALEKTLRFSLLFSDSDVSLVLEYAQYIKNIESIGR